MSFYSSAYSDDSPFSCAYAGRLGRARVSAKGVVTFNNIDDVSLQVLAEMVTAIAAGLESGQLVALSANVDHRPAEQAATRPAAPA